MKILPFITALTLPFALLTGLGGIIVSGIWLAILGEWGPIKMGFILFFIAHFTLSIVLMPTALLAVAGTHCAVKGKTFGMLCFSALSNLYIIVLVTVWCHGILYMFLEDATSSSLIPVLIWSYEVATGPWAYRAAKDQGFASILYTFLAQLAYIVIILLIIFSSVTFIQQLKVFSGFMLLGLVFQMTLAYLTRQEMKGIA